MENPKDIKEVGSWIWKTIQEIYSFLSKPFAGIFLLIVSVGWAWYVSDSKFQKGYDAGVKNQLAADGVNISNLKTQITGLQSEKVNLTVKNNNLQARIDSAKNVDCLEQNEKVFAYVESIKKRFTQENQDKAEKLRETENETRKIRSDSKNIEQLIKNKKKQ